MDNSGVAAHFTVQLCFILVACVLMRRAAGWIGQPPVIGEMIAGVLLGPSLFGLLAPGLQATVFPRDGAPMTILYTLSQIGLVFYMFIIGLEFDTRMARINARGVIGVSASGLLIPLALGILSAAPLLVNDGVYFAKGVDFWHAGLFLGAALATTAFPMLARIISERGMGGTRPGTLALASGALTDAVSWILLAVVIAIFQGNPVIAIVAVCGGALYVGLLLTVGKRLLARFFPSREGRDLSSSSYMVVLILVLASAWYTNAIGIHSIFGGFLLGVAMPRGAVAETVIRRTEPFVKNMLLPLFFVYSGLNTQIGLVNTPLLWLITITLIVAAVVGKGAACYGASRLLGMGHSESLAVGSLMNARGLIELILLNIGLQAGFITPTLFTMLVLMAVVTTLMTAPVFDLAVRHGNFALPPANDPKTDLTINKPGP